MTDASWETLSNQAVAAAGVVYFLALMAHLVQWASLRKLPADEVVTTGRTAMAGRLGVLLTAVAALVHGLALVARGMAADPNRVPWGNMYEFTLSGTFVVTLLYLLLLRRFSLEWMGPLVVGLVLALMMTAVVWLYSPVAPLTEALYSPWLVIHVVSAVIATGAFTLGGICSVLYLLKERSTKERGYLARVPELVSLDRISYRMHAFAFPVWTFAVLITGPIWAHQAWSSYWNWDPKEVWAFITWVVYAAYLHARATVGWKGRNAAYVALVGLATLWFNFIGINFFSTSSQHSYAAPALVEQRPAYDDVAPGRAAQGAGPAGTAGPAFFLTSLAVEVAQEVGVVVGSVRTWRRRRGSSRRRAQAALLGHPHEGVDDQCQQHEEHQELHPPNVGGHATAHLGHAPGQRLGLAG